MMLFEQYNRSNETEQIHSVMKEMWTNHDSMTVSLVEGELSIWPNDGLKENLLEFELFDVQYKFQLSDYGSLEIVKMNGNALDDNEFYNAVNNIKILLRFYKLYKMEDTKIVIRELGRFFEIYNEDKPENFQEEYINYFEEGSFYLSIVDWTDDEISKMSDKNRNLVRSAKSGEKYKLF